MTLWEFFNSTAGAASIVGLIVALGAWLNSRDTQRAIRQIHAKTQRTFLTRALQSKAREGSVIDSHV